jgi:microcystin-dependent protein
MILYFEQALRYDATGRKVRMEAYIGQVLLVGFNFVPVGWARCDGSLLPISEYDVLFNLIGTTYGGDGVQTFALPDLRGRTPISSGQGPGLSPYSIGQHGGTEQVTLTVPNYPAHNHLLLGTSNDGGSQTPAQSFLASGKNIYNVESPIEGMNPAMCGPSPGNSQPHDNLQPYLVCNWIISLFGIFPSQG